MQDEKMQDLDMLINKIDKMLDSKKYSYICVAIDRETVLDKACACSLVNGNRAEMVSLLAVITKAIATATHFEIGDLLEMIVKNTTPDQIKSERDIELGGGEDVKD